MPLLSFEFTMNPVISHVANKTPRTFGKSRPELLQSSDSDKCVGMRPPKKPKPCSVEPGRPKLPAMHETPQFGQQPAADPKWDHVFGVYVEAVAKSDLGMFPKHVENTPARLWPQLAKTLTDDLVTILAAEEQSPPANVAVVSENAAVANAVTRIALALNRGLPLNEVINCLTGEESRAYKVRALSLLLQDCAIRDVEAGKPVDLLSWTQCIGKSEAAQCWMTHLGSFLALGCQNNQELLQRWLSAITSLADQVHGDPTESELVLAFLNGFDGDRYPDLNAYVSPGALSADACMRCDRLRAQLMREADRLVSELSAAVRTASDSMDESLVQQMADDERIEQIRENNQVRSLCDCVLERLTSGVLDLEDVVNALENCAERPDAISTLMCALVSWAKKTDSNGVSALLLQAAKAADPARLMQYVVPALRHEGAIDLARFAMQRLVGEAPKVLGNLLPLQILVEELSRGGKGFEAFGLLNGAMNEEVRTLVRQLLGKAMQYCHEAIVALSRTLSGISVNLTREQLLMLGGGHQVEHLIEVLATTVGRSSIARAYLVEAMRHRTDAPVLQLVMSLLTRVLIIDWSNMDKFVGALLSADVPEVEDERHGLLAQQVAWGLVVWLDSFTELHVHLDSWIEMVPKKLDGSAPRLDVLQRMLHKLSSQNNFGEDARARLDQCRKRVDTLSRISKAEPRRRKYVVPTLHLIAGKREKELKDFRCVMGLHESLFTQDQDIGEGFNKLMLAVGNGGASIREVAEWLCPAVDKSFDQQLLLLMFVKRLLDGSAAPQSGLHDFMASLISIELDISSMKTVAFVCAIACKNRDDREQVTKILQGQLVMFSGDKQERISAFSDEFHGVAGNDTESDSASEEPADGSVDPENDGSSNEADPEMLELSKGIKLVPPDDWVQPTGMTLAPVVREGVMSRTIGTPAGAMHPPPPQVSLLTGAGGTVPQAPGATFDIGVKGSPESLATRLIADLNLGEIEKVKRMIKERNLTRLDLTGTESRLGSRGLLNLGNLLVDPLVSIEELFLGCVGRGVSKMIETAAMSDKLKVLDVSRFDGWDAYKGSQGEAFSCSIIFSTLRVLYSPESRLSLKKLIVSRSQTPRATHELEQLMAAAGARLAVEFI